jgi:hypothetical protein
VERPLRRDSQRVKLTSALPGVSVAGRTDAESARTWGHNDKRPGPHGPGRLVDALGGAAVERPLRRDSQRVKLTSALPGVYLVEHNISKKPDVSSSAIWCWGRRSESSGSSGGGPPGLEVGDVDSSVISDMHGATPAARFTAREADKCAPRCLPGGAQHLKEA